MKAANKTRPYFNCHMQRAAILLRLSQGPATALELAPECNAPDPGRRIRELRAEGYDIAAQPTDRPNPDGTVNTVSLYVLRVKDARQCELNLEP